MQYHFLLILHLSIHNLQVLASTNTNTTSNPWEVDTLVTIIQITMKGYPYYSQCIYGNSNKKESV